MTTCVPYRPKRCPRLASTSSVPVQTMNGPNVPQVLIRMELCNNAYFTKKSLKLFLTKRLKFICIYARWHSTNTRAVFVQPRPQGLLLVQNGGRRNPWPRLPKWLQKFVRILSRKHFEMYSFRLNNSFRLQKDQTGPSDAKANLRKSRFIRCHVTKYSTILGVFQQPWPGVSPTAILNEEKALGTRLVFVDFLTFFPIHNAVQL